MLKAKRIVIGIAAVTLATACMGMANGDVDRVRLQLKDGSCLVAGDQIRDRIHDCDETCVPICDGIPDQDRDQIRLHLDDTV